MTLPPLTLSASVQTVSFGEHSKFYARRINMSSSPSVSSSATRACTSAAVLMSLLLALAVNHQVGAAAVDTTVVADTAVVTDATSTADVGSSNDSAVVAASTAGSTLDTTDLTDTADNVLQPAGYGLAPAKPSQPPPAQAKYEDIYSFVVHSKVKYRYAQTVVSSRVANKGNTSHEVQFYVTLPESAFVSKFLMEINEKVYEAYVKEKKEAKEEYIAAVNSGQTAAHVEQNARDSNKFTVSVNVEAESKVTFNLTYEQLLNRKLGIYENVINLQPGQVVKNLQVIVDIEESSNITTLEVPDIKTANEIETTVSKNKLAKISRESGNKATITWSPTVKEQLTFTENGVKGQFIVQYDVDHNSTPNQVLIDDGYFVHFFAPTDLKPLRTHVIFVLDVSGSMVGQKLPQVKEAMGQILSEIHSEDFFTLILFSDFAQVWTINATQETSNRWDETGNNWKTNNNFSLETLGENRFVFPATEQNIQYAKKFIQDLTSESSTNMEDALTKAHSIAKLGETRFKDGANTPKPIIVFLTDGEPTTGITEPQELIKYVSNTNEEKYPIFSLGFGEGADIDFLKKLSLNNTGFARVIYEASDASLQLRNFYKEISSPVLSNVTFQYIDAQVDNITVTKKSFNLLFKETELVVSGKLKDGTSPVFNGTLNAVSTEGNFNRSVVVSCFDIPIIPPTSLPTQRRIGHLEKLWAYLNIQQLLDKYELNKNENSTAKAKALELALEYSFVTPLTSLVVVKPNDTTTSVALEKIKPLNDSYNFGFSRTVTPFSALGPPLPPSMQMPMPFSGRSSRPPFITPKSSKYRPLFILKSYTKSEDDTSESIGVFTNMSSLQVSHVDNSTPTSTIDFSHLLVLIDKSNSTSLHDIKELTWLSDSITLNATNTVYQVSLNTTGQSYQNCTTPDQSYGNCKHLKDCVVPSILNSFDTYLSLFCPIETLYAGICCLV
ncbi:inter-alpha-trypsin inhibitor heavy chain H3-like isoform X3 [Aphis gossypii]|uniref:inter-alpha-trypsin inhibitor heavy chain H3-like isoform X3 n=1 Tax=Aphis gossypii TaxID=80765 RepID=UPI002159197D|nr:inter-alpha-trypsin inhibitor heavy chain H3-like isoform X3 [Aphis gossypii]